MRKLNVLMIGCALLASARPLAPQGLRVETEGVTARIRFEAPLGGGHLAELSGRYKLRVTEIDIAPGGHVGEHNHAGPGIRLMTVGRMEYAMPDKTVLYGPGDFFFEAGDVSHKVFNHTKNTCQHLLFEILPVDTQGPSLIPPKNPQKRH